MLKGKPLKVLSDQAVFSGSSFVVTLAMARMLGPEGFGYLTTIVLYVYLLASAVSAYVVQPYQVTFSKIQERKQYDSFVFALQVGIVLVVLLLTVLLLQLRLNLIEGIGGNELFIMVYVAGFLFHDFARKILLAQDSLSKVLMLDVLLMLCQIAAVAVLYFWLNLNLHNAFKVLAFSYALPLVLSVIFIQPSFRSFTGWSTYLNLHIKQGGWLFLTAIVQWWSNNLFVVASGVFLGAHALGAFRLVQSLFGVLNIFLQTIENYILPKAAEKLSRSAAESKYFLKNIGLKGIVLFAVVLGLMFVFSNLVIVLAGGDQYTGYGFVVKGMSLLYLLIYIGYANRISIRMLVLNQHFFIGYALTLIVSVLLFNYLLKSWGLWGAIAGLVMNQLILFAYWQYVLIKNKFLLWK